VAEPATEREILMAGQRDCDSAVIAGRISKAIEFFDAADLLGKEMANAAGDLTSTPASPPRT